MRAAVLNQIGDTELELRDDVTTTDEGAARIGNDIPFEIAALVACGVIRQIVTY